MKMNFELFVRLFTEYEFFSRVFEYERESFDLYQELLEHELDAPKYGIPRCSNVRNPSLAETQKYIHCDRQTDI